MRNIIAVSTIAFAAVVSAATAQASNICQPHDASKWMSKEAITAKAVEMGYEVRAVKMEDGCWEVKGTKDGNRVEAYLDPITAEVVLTK